MRLKKSEIFGDQSTLSVSVRRMVFRQSMAIEGLIKGWVFGTEVEEVVSIEGGTTELAAKSSIRVPVACTCENCNN